MTANPKLPSGDMREIRYIRPIVPVRYPDSDPEWEMSENKRHQRLCKVLRELLAVAAGVERAAIGSDQFVYFDTSNPKRKCAPDGLVKLGVPDWDFDVWKTWEDGVPELCVEVLSPSDTKEKLTLEEKLRRFHTMGVGEVVCFDVDEQVGRRIRAWDLVSGDLVERVVEQERTPCRTLGRWFVVGEAPLDALPAALRLAEDGEGAHLVPLPREADRADQERAIAETDRAVAELEKLRSEPAQRRG